jgi:hypothetical protein
MKSRPKTPRKSPIESIASGKVPTRRETGRIFKRGSVYWIAYCYRGKEHRESSRSTNEAQALKLLKKRIGETANGKLIGPVEERVTFEDLADELLTDYEVNRLRSIRSVRLSIKHLKA